MIHAHGYCCPIWPCLCDSVLFPRPRQQSLSKMSCAQSRDALVPAHKQFLHGIRRWALFIHVSFVAAKTNNI